MPRKEAPRSRSEVFDSGSNRVLSQSASIPAAMTLPRRSGIALIRHQEVAVCHRQGEKEEADHDGGGDDAVRSRSRSDYGEADSPKNQEATNSRSGTIL